MDKVRVLLIDDSHIVLKSVRLYLEAMSPVEVVGETTSGEGILSLIEEQKPDVVVCDFEMPGTSGLTVIKQLRAHYPKIGRVILTLHDTTLHQKAAFEAGAHAFVSKATVTALIPAIEQALRAVGKEGDEAQASSTP